MDRTPITIACAKKILVINTEPILRELLHFGFTDSRQWQVLSVGSPYEGLQRAMQGSPDAIVLDLATSSSNSYFAFLEKLREQTETQLIPVIILTVGAKWLDTKRLTQFQVVGVLDYTPDLNKLFNQIAALLNWNEDITKNITC
jgi:CheY-like chemotaxis protein